MGKTLGYSFFLSKLSSLHVDTCNYDINLKELIMNLATIGKYLFIIPVCIFGLFHFMNANDMAGMVPSWLPGGVFWVYLTGAAFILALISFFINKKAKLAMTLLGVMLLIFAIFVNFVGFIGGNEMQMSQVLKDTALAGGAFMLSGMMED